MEKRAICISFVDIYALLLHSKKYIFNYPTGESTVFFNNITEKCRQKVRKKNKGI